MSKPNNSNAPRLTASAARPFSHVVTDGPHRAPARAMLRGAGLTDEDLQRPLVAVVNTWSEVTPCNVHLRALAEPLKGAIREAGVRARRHEVAVVDMKTFPLSLSLTRRHVK